MRLKSYLVESDESYSSVEELYEILIKDCAPFFKEFGNKITFMEFYRGRNKASLGNNTIRKMTPRQDRKPLTMPRIAHDWLDMTFNKKFKWKPRSHGVFATTSRTESGNYGESFLFFPIGKYKYIYHPEIIDLYMEVPEPSFIHALDGKTEYLDDRDRRDNRDFEALIDEYTNKNLSNHKGTGTNIEVMFGCKEYYLVNSNESGDLQSIYNQRGGK